MITKNQSIQSNESHRRGSENKIGISKGAIIEAAFLIYALALLIHWSNTPWVRTLSVTFVAIVLEAFPFMLIGSLVSGFIEEFVSRDKISSILPKGKNRAVFLAAGMGIMFPVCECAVVPVIRRLLRKGVPFSAAIAFLLGGPIVNPIVIASTAVAYQLNWMISAVRLFAGYLIAVGMGLIMGLLFKHENAFLQDGDSEFDNHSSISCVPRYNANHYMGARIRTALIHAADDFFDMVRFLIIGAFFAATIQCVIDRSIYLIFSENSWLAIAVMMLLAIVLNLCSEADAFVASTFQFSVPLSGQMAFMVLGPMFDLKLLFMYLGVFQKRAIVTLTLFVLVTVFVTMIITDLFFGLALK